LQRVDLEINVTAVALERMVFAEAVDQLLEQLDALEVGDRVEGRFSKRARLSWITSLQKAWKVWMDTR
jgi:hypothetical protein